MAPLLTSLWPLAALLAVPALVAIYLFQRRFRARDVSSLMLWEAIREPSMGGRTREPLRLPLTFWLELAAIVLLALAAAGPLIPYVSHDRPLVVVLDDSLSMRAGARERAKSFVSAMNPTHVVFAGATPQLAGDDPMREWTCGAASADLDAAVGFATQIGGPNALVLVVTDHAPDRKLEKGRLEWRAFGSATPNLAFTAAARSGERVLIEIASYSNQTERTTLTMSSGYRATITLPPRGRYNAIVAARGANIEAHIEDGADFDNHVVLLPDDRPPVRVAVDIGDEKLRDAVERALDATGRVARGLPVLLITDHPTTDNQTWSLEIQSAKGNAGFIGPYIIDRTHPLSEGLALDGVVWGAQRGTLPGTAVILAGNQTLLTDEELANGAHRLRMRFDPAISNLQRSPAWPALIWNLVSWRAARTPGTRTPNITLGSEAMITLRDANEAVRVMAPDKTTQTIASRGTDVVVAATQPGIWSVRSGNEQYRFAANALVAGESDLSRAVSGTWGGWSDTVLTTSGYQNIAWLLLLIVLIALVLHQLVLRVRTGNPAGPVAGRIAGPYTNGQP